MISTKSAPHRRSRVLRATPVIGALWLAACASTPRPDPAVPSVDVPPTWAQGATTADAPQRLDTWWAALGDPLLSRLIDDARANNSTLEGAIASLRQARALRDVAAASLRPSLGGSAGVQRSRSGNEPAANLFKAGLDASWEPDLFGGVAAALSGRDADVQSRRATLDDAQVSVTAEVGLAYIQLRGAQQRLAIAQANLSAQQETLQIAQWRTQAGLASSLDVEQARAASLQTQAQLPALAKSIAQSGHSLAVLTGRPPAALAQTLAEAAPVPMPAAPMALDIPADTLRRRPDVRAAEWAFRAAAAGVSEAEAARMPAIRLSGSLGLNALTLGSLTSGGAVAAAVLASLSVPLFDGGAGKAQVRAQESALDKTRADYRAAVLGALRDVEDALVAMQNDRLRLTTLQQAAEAAANGALLARQRYEGGLIDFQVVLDTQRTLLGAQDSVASAAADLSADHVRLFKALGGGWSPDLPTATIGKSADRSNNNTTTNNTNSDPSLNTLAVRP